MLRLDVSNCDSVLKLERRIQTFERRYVRDLWTNRGERASEFRRSARLKLEVVRPSKSHVLEIKGETAISVLEPGGPKVTDRLAAARSVIDVLEGGFAYALSVVRNARLAEEGRSQLPLPSVSPAQLALAKAVAPQYVATERAGSKGGKARATSA